MSDHLYPMDTDKLQEFSVHVSKYNIPFVIGEFGWNNKDADVEKFLIAMKELQSYGLLSGSLFWSMFGHAEQYGHVTHDFTGQLD